MTRNYSVGILKCPWHQSQYRKVVPFVYWDRSKDNDLIKSLEIDYHIFNGSLLWEPESILKDDGTPYKVFTPFYRKGCIKAGKTPREPLPKAKLNFISAQDRTSLDELNLLPVHPWKKKIESKWEMGEDSAMKRLDDFLENGIQYYKEGRNYPAKSFVAKRPSVDFLVRSSLVRRDLSVDAQMFSTSRSFLENKV